MSIQLLPNEIIQMINDRLGDIPSYMLSKSSLDMRRIIPIRENRQYKDLPSWIIAKNVVQNNDIDGINYFMLVHPNKMNILLKFILKYNNQDLLDYLENKYNVVPTEGDYLLDTMYRSKDYDMAFDTNLSVLKKINKDTLFSYYAGEGDIYLVDNVLNYFGKPSDKTLLQLLIKVAYDDDVGTYDLIKDYIHLSNVCDIVKKYDSQKIKQHIIENADDEYELLCLGAYGHVYDYIVQNIEYDDMTELIIEYYKQAQDDDNVDEIENILELVNAYGLDDDENIQQIIFGEK